MAAFEITSFLKFASLLLAARKLATDPDLIDGTEALADLGVNGKALAAALKRSGLTPLAREMARAAEQARTMTHPGHAIDDAQAIFWQVAPEAFADPSIFAAETLDALAITDAMVGRTRTSPHRRDFETRDLNEAYFRKVCHLMLSQMPAEPAPRTT